MRYEDDCEGLEEDIEGTVVDRVKRLWRRVEDVVKTSNCETKNSRTSSIKGVAGRGRQLTESWSKVCDSDWIVPSPSRSVSGQWCWVGRGGSSRPNPNPKRKRRDRFRELGCGMDWTDERKQDFVGKGLHQYLGKRRSRKDLRNLDKDDIYQNDKIVSWAMSVL
ncbi:hypothetical protein F2Q68_00035504 [Brassica cretica]|uniref:Uncharacterized protein n=1 Tax=Brassica cretica TaxID=69181 RepID=A0A8S9H5Z2_BRACR|nr:hypothetical protein F2Q68_00035504 [Brassica cretica]